MPIDKTPWTDETVMPWGDHKGKLLRDVPAQHLLWLFQQRWIADWPGLYSYLRSATVQARIDEARKQVVKNPVPETIQTFEDYLKDYRGF